MNLDIQEQPITTSEGEKWCLDMLATSNIYFPHIADLLHRSVDDVIRLLRLSDLSDIALREWISGRRRRGETREEILSGFSHYARSSVETILLEIEYDDTDKSTR